MDVSVFGVGIVVDTGQVFVQFLYGRFRCQHFQGFLNGFFVFFRNVGIVTQPLKGRFLLLSRERRTGTVSQSRNSARPSRSEEDGVKESTPFSSIVARSAAFAASTVASSII